MYFKNNDISTKINTNISIGCISLCGCVVYNIRIYSYIIYFYSFTYKKNKL